MKIRFAGFEENFDIPAFSIYANDFFFRQTCVGRNQCKPVFSLAFVADTYDFSERNASVVDEGEAW